MQTVFAGRLHLSLGITVFLCGTVAFAQTAYEPIKATILVHDVKKQEVQVDADGCRDVQESVSIALTSKVAKDSPTGLQQTHDYIRSKAQEFIPVNDYILAYLSHGLGEKEVCEDSCTMVQASAGCRREILQDLEFCTRHKDVMSCSVTYSCTLECIPGAPVYDFSELDLQVKKEKSKKEAQSVKQKKEEPKLPSLKKVKPVHIAPPPVVFQNVKKIEKEEAQEKCEEGEDCKDYEGISGSEESKEKNDDQDKEVGVEMRIQEEPLEMEEEKCEEGEDCKDYEGISGSEESKEKNDDQDKEVGEEMRIQEEPLEMEEEKCEDCEEYEDHMQSKECNECKAFWDAQDKDPFIRDVETPDACFACERFTEDFEDHRECEEGEECEEFEGSEGSKECNECKDFWDAKDEDEFVADELIPEACWVCDGFKEHHHEECKKGEECEDFEDLEECGEDEECDYPRECEEGEDCEEYEDHMQSKECNECKEFWDSKEGQVITSEMTPDICYRCDYFMEHKHELFEEMNEPMHPSECEECKKFWDTQGDQFVPEEDIPEACWVCDGFKEHHYEEHEECEECEDFEDLEECGEDEECDYPRECEEGEDCEEYEMYEKPEQDGAIYPSAPLPPPPNDQQVFEEDTIHIEENIPETTKEEIFDPSAPSSPLEPGAIYPPKSYVPSLYREEPQEPLPSTTEPDQTFQYPDKELPYTEILGEIEEGYHKALPTGDALYPQDIH